MSTLPRGVGGELPPPGRDRREGREERGGRKGREVGERREGDGRWRALINEY